MGMKFLAAHALVVLSILALSVGVTGLFYITAYTFNKRISVELFNQQLLVLAFIILISFCTLVSFTAWG